jgi:hypothetical protein
MGTHRAHLVSRDDHVEEPKQLLVLLRLDVKVTPVGRRGDSNGHLVLVQVPDQAVDTCMPAK